VRDKKTYNRIKQFKRIVMSFADFKEAVDLSTILIESNLLEDQDNNFLMLGALTNAMVLAYSRPFSGNDSKGNNKIPDLRGKALRNLNEDEKVLHEWLLKQRHTLIAHSASEAVDLKFEIYDLAGRKFLRPIRNRNTRHFSLEHALSFKALAEKMLNYVAVERSELESEMLELLDNDDIEEVISFNAEELSNNA